MAMAGLLNYEMPRPRGSVDENLLGMDPDIGMTDRSFQDMGRAPVDELWAGRFAVGIDDNEFAEREAEAKNIRDFAIANKESMITAIMEDGYDEEEAEFMWMGMSREVIKDKTGLDLYPGDLTEGEKEPQFMQEFSDAAAGFRHDGIGKIRSGDPAYLGEIIQHPRLFEQYPEAQFMPVGRLDSEDGSLGAYGNYTHYAPEHQAEIKEGAPLGLMMVNPEQSDDEMMSTILHELQHYISSVEGWENGGAPTQELAEQYLDDQLGYAGAAGMAGDRAEHIQGVIDSQDGLFDFSRKESLAEDEGVQFTAYEDLSGEELARAVERRWAEGTQGEYFYGSPDKSEEQNWSQEEGAIVPLDTTAAFRREMSDMGLLGNLTRKTLMEVIEAGGENYQGPHTGKRDEYIEEMEKRIREMMKK